MEQQGAVFTSPGSLKYLMTENLRSALAIFWLDKRKSESIRGRLRLVLVCPTVFITFNSSAPSFSLKIFFPFINFLFLTVIFPRMIVNTLSNLLIFNFEAVQWDFNLESERPEGLGNLNIYAKTPPRRLARSHVRAHSWCALTPETVCLPGHLHEWKHLQHVTST